MRYGLLYMCKMLQENMLRLFDGALARAGIPQASLGSRRSTTSINSNQETIMSIIRYTTPKLPEWSPFDRLASLRDEMDRLFDFSAPTRDAGLFSGWSPALDLYDEKDSFVAKVELPGVSKDAIQISLHEGVLSVSGERKHEYEGKEGQTFRSERSFGKFQRSVTLPARVDAAKVTASYKDGILTVHIPKTETAKQKPKQITVQ